MRRFLVIFIALSFSAILYVSCTQKPEIDKTCEYAFKAYDLTLKAELIVCSIQDIFRDEKAIDACEAAKKATQVALLAKDMACNK